MLTIRVADEDRLVRYMFAHHTAEFLICSECGVYVASVTVGTDQQRAIAQLNTIEDNQHFGHAVAVNYNDESQAERVQRRREVWMPVTIAIA